jgi:ribosomal protein S18 acetylase RimI-like enzyme
MGLPAAHPYNRASETRRENGKRCKMSFEVRNATAADGDGILALMPRLASFDVPESRNPEDLWRSDAATFERWLAGAAPECLVSVAVAPGGKLLGFTMVSLRPELLSHEPSAHLEAIAVAEAAEGQGVGKALLAAAEREAGAQGALTMTLHVFASNERARAVYERAGYDGELLRYIKPIAGAGTT